MTDDKENPKSAWFGPLDLLGGVRMNGAIGGEVNVIPFLDRSGGLAGSYEEKIDDEGKRVRETAGKDWSVVANESVMVNTFGDLITFQNRVPRLSCSYLRDDGRMVEVHVGVSDLIKTMVEQGLASQQDLMSMEVIRGQGFDLAVSLVFREDAQPLLFLSRVLLLPSPTIVASKQETIEMDRYGIIPGRPNFNWLGNLDALQGKVGVEVYEDSVVFFYQMGEPRKDVFRINRVLAGVNKFDRLVRRRMPSGEEIEHLKKDILGV